MRSQIRTATWAAMVVLCHMATTAWAAPGDTTRVSVASDGVQGNPAAEPFSAPAVSADGNVVAFESSSDNLVPGVANGFQQIYVHDRTATTMIPYRVR